MKIKIPKQLLFNFPEVLQKKEPLNPELMPYLADKSGFMAIQHPLFYDVPFFPGGEALANARFAINQYLAEQYLEAKDYLGYISVHERPYRIDALLEVYDKLDAEVCIEAFLEHFVDSENVSQAKGDWIGLIEYMGVEAIQEHLNDREMLEPVNLSNPGKIEVFRGVCLQDASEPSTHPKHIGLSWTTDYDVAERFANRFTTKESIPVIISTEVSIENVIGPFNTRDEMEVIILPEHIILEQIDVNYLNDVDSCIKR